MVANSSSVIVTGGGSPQISEPLTWLKGSSENNPTDSVGDNIATQAEIEKQPNQPLVSNLLRL